jgi:hypothetical protein
MSTIAVVHSGIARSGGGEIVLAIVGGTMLTLALTRPRLRWLERLTEDSKSQRVWAERGLTGFAFIMGGYAWAALFLTLQRRLDPESAALLRGAAALLVVYAWLSHFEPFVREWRLQGGLAAGALYTGFAILAAGTGVTAAEIMRTSSINAGDAVIMGSSAAAAAFCWVLFKLLPPSVGTAPSTRTPARSTQASRRAARR